MSDNADNGGVAGGNPDPVSDATKWLYYEITSGDYSSMYTTATGFGLSNNVGANFQNAIWYLEQERTASEIGGTSSAGYLLATYALSNQNWSALFAAGNRVYAMNLTDAAGGRHQDQLAYELVSTPEPGSLMLLGAGLLVVSRKLVRKRAKVTTTPVRGHQLVDIDPAYLATAGTPTAARLGAVDARRPTARPAATSAITALP